MWHTINNTKRANKQYNRNKYKLNYVFCWRLQIPVIAQRFPNNSPFSLASISVHLLNMLSRFNRIQTHQENVYNYIRVAYFYTKKHALFRMSLLLTIKLVGRSLQCYIFLCFSLQLVRLNAKGQLAIGERCVDADSQGIKLVFCKLGTVNGPWEYDEVCFSPVTSMYI